MYRNAGPRVTYSRKVHAYEQICTEYYRKDTNEELVSYSNFEGTIAPRIRRSGLSIHKREGCTAGTIQVRRQFIGNAGRGVGHERLSGTSLDASLELRWYPCLLSESYSSGEAQDTRVRPYMCRGSLKGLVRIRRFVLVV